MITFVVANLFTRSVCCLDLDLEPILMDNSLFFSQKLEFNYFVCLYEKTHSVYVCRFL
jgi:hypothetical protein